MSRRARGRHPWRFLSGRPDTESREKCRPATDGAKRLGLRAACRRFGTFPAAAKDPRRRVSTPVPRKQYPHVTIPKHFIATCRDHPGQSGGKPPHSTTLRDSSRHQGCPRAGGVSAGNRGAQQRLHRLPSQKREMPAGGGRREASWTACGLPPLLDVSNRRKGSTAQDLQTSSEMTVFLDYYSAVIYIRSSQPPPAWAPAFPSLRSSYLCGSIWAMNSPQRHEARKGRRGFPLSVSASFRVVCGHLPLGAAPEPSLSPIALSVRGPLAGANVPVEGRRGRRRH